MVIPGKHAGESCHSYDHTDTKKTKDEECWILDRRAQTRTSWTLGLLTSVITVRSWQAEVTRRKARFGLLEMTMVIR